VDTASILVIAVEEA
jgi:ribonuclease HI